MMMTAVLLIVVIISSAAHDIVESAGVVLSNVELPLDQEGRPVITGETSVATVNGTHYIYVNDWGTCQSIDCCASSGGCASCCFVPPTKQYPDPCVFATGHRVLVYATTDLRRWRLLGVALTPIDRPRGIEFRPHVIYNEYTRKFVMWYEDRPPPRPGHKFDSKGYDIATATSPAGPFETIATGVRVADVPGDFDLFIDDDGTAYHVQTTTNDPNATRGFAITVLNQNYTAPAAPRKTATFKAPKPAEGPVIFKRKSSYYILEVSGGELLWLGNQWVSGHGAVRNSDLLYWSILNFDESGDVQQFEWSANCTLPR